MPDTAHRLATVPLGLHPSLGFSQVRGGGAAGSAAASIEADRADAYVLLGPSGTYASADWVDHIDSSAWTAFGVLSRSFGSDYAPTAATFTVPSTVNDGFGVIDENGEQKILVDDGTSALYFSNTTDNHDLIHRGDGDIRRLMANGQTHTIDAPLMESHTLALAGTSDTAILIPANALVKYVSVRVTTLITGCTTFDYGVAGDATRYGTGLALTAGTTNVGPDSGGFARYYPAATAIRFTAVGGGASFTAGVIRVTIHYETATAATS